MLKSNTFLTVQEAAKWTKLNEKKYGAVGGTKAVLTKGDLTFTAKYGGENGNNIAIEFITGGTAGAEEVTVAGNKITAKIDPGVSTAAQIKLALDAAALSLITTTIAAGQSSVAQSAFALDFLTGGVWGADYDQTLVDTVEDIINAVTDMVESILGANVLARDYEEVLDGNNSNVLIPSQWPIQEVTEIKIDTNRNFDSATALDTVNYFLRGQVDKRQIPSISLRIIGQDIVIRDDNEKYILGRMFAGSALGSIKLKYKAGWGSSVQDIPSDIRMATLIAFEFFFMQRDNRDLNIQSKGVKGESYTKVEKSIPQQIYDLLEPFKDVSLGNHQMPQRNTFKI